MSQIPPRDSAHVKFPDPRFNVECWECKEATSNFRFRHRYRDGAIVTVNGQRCQLCVQEFYHEGHGVFCDKPDHRWKAGQVPALAEEPVITTRAPEPVAAPKPIHGSVIVPRASGLEPVVRSNIKSERIMQLMRDFIEKAKGNASSYEARAAEEQAEKVTVAEEKVHRDESFLKFQSMLNELKRIPPTYRLKEKRLSVFLGAVLFAR